VKRSRSRLAFVVLGGWVLVVASVLAVPDAVLPSLGVLALVPVALWVARGYDRQGQEAATESDARARFVRMLALQARWIARGLLVISVGNLVWLAIT
jgi:hypothetical protein